MQNIQCNRCLLDTKDDPAIFFDNDGICNYCNGYDKKANEVLLPAREAAAKLDEILTRIKRSGTGKKYDSIMGVSGGVDSTYLAWKAREWGLRPLLVHLDNGWNSELSVVNIENIIARTGFDLFTHVVEWDEFKDIQLSFFKANVVDIELVSDHAIFTTLYDLALKHGIKYILSGRNLVTEEILPKNWIHNKGDSVNIRSIHGKFGSIPFKTYPLLTPAKKVKVMRARLQSVNLLDLIDYNKKLVKDIIIRELGWRDYGGKHYESVFTRFYQGYILPRKFGIDKRKAHLSNLICSGQLSKKEALEELQAPIYDPNVLKADYDFVLKKLGFTHDEFERYIREPRKEHSDYGIEKPLLDTFPILKLLYKLKQRILN